MMRDIIKKAESWVTIYQCNELRILHIEFYHHHYHQQQQPFFNNKPTTPPSLSSLPSL
jgi:hypothetical protein